MIEFMATTPDRNLKEVKKKTLLWKEVSIESVLQAANLRSPYLSNTQAVILTFIILLTKVIPHPYIKIKRRKILSKLLFELTVRSKLLER